MKTANHILRHDRIAFAAVTEAIKRLCILLQAIEHDLLRLPGTELKRLAALIEFVRALTVVDHAFDVVPRHHARGHGVCARSAKPNIV